MRVKNYFFMWRRFFHLTASFFLLNIYQVPSLALKDCEMVFVQSSVSRNGKTTKQPNKSFGMIGASDLFERKKWGEETLGRSLNQNATSALEEAHLVGRGEKGKDGKPAGIGNYTEAQIKKKAVILKQAGFSKEERRKLMKAGVVGWKFWKKSKMRPPTDIVDELNEKSTKVLSRISAYRVSMIEFGNEIFSSDQNYPDFFENNNHNMRSIGDSYYWTRYIPRSPKRGEKAPPDDGQFIIGFAIRVKSGYSARNGWWYHRLHWKSRARDKQMNQEAIKEIFQEIYGGKPEEVITNLQDKYLSGKQAVEEVERHFIFPFIFDPQKKQEVTEIVQRAVNKRGSQTVSENAE